MPREIYLVKVGMSMTEGMVSEWFIPDGGQVKKGELVYALETEKVNLDVDAEYNGTVRHLVAPGVTLAPGDVVGYIFEAGEDIPDTLPGASEAAPAVTSEQAPASPEPAPVAAVASSPAATPAPVAVEEPALDVEPTSAPVEEAAPVVYDAQRGTEGSFDSILHQTDASSP